MNTFARIILVFLSLLLIGASLFLLAANYDLIPGIAMSSWMPGWANETIVLAAVGVLLLLALILLILGLKPKKKAANAVVKGSEFGEVMISITAVENMVLRVVQQTRGIKDISRKVVFTPDGLIVRIVINVMPDIALPELITELQSRTKEYLEEITGITVHEVKVLVENVNMDQAASKK